MSDTIRDAAVKLLDARDHLFGVQAIPPALSIAVEELRTAVLRDKERRDVSANADGPLLSIPSEPLFLTPRFAALTRSQWRLFGAYHIAGKLVGGLTGLMESNSHAEIAAKAVRLSDRVLKANDEIDRPPPVVAAAVAVNGGPHTPDVVKLAGQDDDAA